MAGIGDEFLQATKYAPEAPAQYAPVDESAGVTVELAKPPRRETAALSELLTARRSRRHFTGGSISLDDLSYLLWASDGVSHEGGNEQLRTAPSAGAKHPIDTFLIVSRVDGLDRGVYRYEAGGHYLQRLRAGDFEEAAVRAAAGQEWLRGSVAVFVWVAEFARTTLRYKERGYRYAFLDAGHICQNLYLACESLSLGMTAIAALIDDEASALVGADGTERSVVYMAGMGKV